MEVIAITDKIQRRQSKSAGDKGDKAGKGTFGIGTPTRKSKKGGEDEQYKLQYEIGEIERAIYAKVVHKCGNRLHWEEWAADIARIARTHIDRITAILENAKNKKEREAFEKFADEIRDDLNGSVSDVEVIEMLAQHLITKPVFEALFSDYSFAQHNPMSKAMQGVVDILETHRLEKETDTLQKFYDSVRMRASGIDSAQGKQKIVVELYDNFFRNAFPKMTERLGIVYTPVEVVDFIIHSVNDVLTSEFGQTLGGDGVHIIDPFTGTGTFITRLLQSGLMTSTELKRKYASQLHANEIVLLAYYIAAINIEAAYHGVVGGNYVPFDGICLTDTFQMYENDDQRDFLLVDNSKRRRRQKKLDIRVIVGNPPYSSGQDSANDQNENVEYPRLDDRISATYAERSAIRMVRSLYDSYIRALRWASDRIGQSGVIGFVTNAGFLDSSSADGMRKCLAEEFNDIYVFHLRGNQRTSGDRSRREGGKIFGGGSPAPIAITLLVKNPASKHKGKIKFHDIGDYLSREEKLSIVSKYRSTSGIASEGKWTIIEPDTHGDWLKQRDTSFSKLMVLGDKRGLEPKLFASFSNGVKSNRDVWVFNSSAKSLSKNIERMSLYFNAEARRLGVRATSASKSEIDSLIRVDKSQISWADDLKGYLRSGVSLRADAKVMTQSLYRPFTKQWLHYDRRYLWSLYQMPQMFPTGRKENRLICVFGVGGKVAFSALMTDCVPSLHMVDIDGSQCFPLRIFEVDDSDDGATLFGRKEDRTATSRLGLTDEGLAHFANAYPHERISKEDLFYYVYGLLHSPDYRDRFADNLSKELPRIPRVTKGSDFWAFSKAGRAIADLHINYEKVAIYGGAQVVGGGKPGDYRVERMRYGKSGKEKDLTTLHYNDKISVTGIPIEAYEYVVNGKPALDWVVERQSEKTDKDSGIVNDANDWAVEAMKNPKYPLKLFLRVITVSLETMKIVRSLPKLEISGPIKEAAE